MSFPKAPKQQAAPPPPLRGMDAPEILSLAKVDEDADLAMRRSKGLSRLRVPLNSSSMASRLALSGTSGVQV